MGGVHGVKKPQLCVGVGALDPLVGRELQTDRRDRNIVAIDAVEVVTALDRSLHAVAGRLVARRTVGAGERVPLVVVRDDVGQAFGVWQRRIDAGRLVVGRVLVGGVARPHRLGHGEVDPVFEPCPIADGVEGRLESRPSGRGQRGFTLGMARRNRRTLHQKRLGLTRSERRGQRDEPLPPTKRPQSVCHLARRHRFGRQPFFQVRIDSDIAGDDRRDVVQHLSVRFTIGLAKLCGELHCERDREIKRPRLGEQLRDEPGRGDRRRLLKIQIHEWKLVLTVGIGRGPRPPTQRRPQL